MATLCSLPECSGIAIVPLFGTGFAFAPIVNITAAASTPSAEGRGGVCSRGTAGAEIVGWGGDAVGCQSTAPQSCCITDKVHDDSPKLQSLVAWWMRPMGTFQPAVLPMPVWQDLLPLRVSQVRPELLFTTATA